MIKAVRSDHEDLGGKIGSVGSDAIDVLQHQLIGKDITPTSLTHLPQTGQEKQAVTVILLIKGSMKL